MLIFVRSLHWSTQVLILWLLLDILMLMLHLVFGSFSYFFHLDVEHNLPAIYQATKLLTVGYLTLFRLIKIPKLKTAKKWLLYPLSLLLIFVGLDELGQIHEHVEFFVRQVSPKTADAVLNLAESLGYFSSTWMLYYLPFFVAVGIYGLAVLFDVLRHHRSLLPVLFLSGVFIALVIVFEFLSNQGQVDSRLYHQYITLEETAEMIGISLAGFFALRWQRAALDRQ